MMPPDEVKERAFKEDRDRCLQVIKYLMADPEIHTISRIIRVNKATKKFLLDWPRYE